ncbi:hypothetical protein OIE50_24015 [Streptomyces canus]|uniref:hypothetical protein n=1 Tax=Streptomyces canus TaxID=58343 RepID=UPI003249DFF0
MITAVTQISTTVTIRLRRSDEALLAEIHEQTRAAHAVDVTPSCRSRPLIAAFAAVP